MEIITAETFKTYCQNPNFRHLEVKEDMPKVLEAGPDQIIKIFYPRSRKWSSSRYRPHALRFCRNVKKLAELNIAAPSVQKIQYCKELNTYLVLYQKLHGESVYQSIKAGNKQLMHHTIRFVSHLHDKGIYFRGLHLTNLLLLDNNQIALLDVVDMQFKNKPLSLLARYRNLKHLFFHRMDHQFWLQINREELLKSYIANSSLSLISKKIFSGLLNKLLQQP